jgi:hypothetical protein
MFGVAITIGSPAAAIALLPAGMKDVQIQGLIIQPDDGATNPFFIGGSDVAVTTPYWFRINAPAGGVPPVPFVLEFPQTGLGQLSQLYVIGTAGEILRVTVIPR